jgi:hypothetical protein
VVSRLMSQSHRYVLRTGEGRVDPHLDPNTVPLWDCHTLPLPLCLLKSPQCLQCKRPDGARNSNPLAIL